MHDSALRVMRLRFGPTESIRAEVPSLADVYDAHHEALRTFALRLVGDEEEAEDLVQETFLTLAQALRSYRGDSSLRTFVLGIAANHARHHVRAAARRRAAYARVRAEEEHGAVDVRTPEDGTDRRELAAALTRALDELPFDQRLALVLCEVEERTAAEAAKIAAAPEATMRTRVFHAKRKLREILAARGFR